MSRLVFKPTEQQTVVINHAGSAFVEACPGAGKTKVMVERARRLLGSAARTQGIAFLSFTNAAIDELAFRLRKEGLVSTTPFPHFMGTFDSFLWNFLFAPFGVPDCASSPKLMADMGEFGVRRFEGDNRPLALSCFDRLTGNIVAGPRDLGGVDPASQAARNYEAAARKILARFREQGFVDHDDVRMIALDRIRDAAMSSRLATTMAARFSEVIVDEAQDCNPADLEVIRWLRSSGLPTMVICDPHQSIYAFRGGVTNHLFTLRDEFGADGQLPMTGNFRSNGAICKAIVALRDRDHRVQRDEPLGRNKDDSTPVHILSYRGSPTSAVGDEFRKLLEAYKISASCPVLATTRECCGNAIGQPAPNDSEHMSLRLAGAVTDFHFARESRERIQAMEELHRITLKMEGRLDRISYRKFLSDGGITPDSWRPRIISLLSQLRYDATAFATADAWLEHARSLLAGNATGGRTINQLLRASPDLAKALAAPSPLGLAARTIHSVKGMEFPAVCVVLSTHIAKGVIDHLVDGGGSDVAQENMRKIYVAASRAERLLVLAVPHTQAARLKAHLTSYCARVETREVPAFIASGASAFPDRS